MKLLLDENLSRRIVPFLQTAFPGSSQIVLEGLEQSFDLDIWQYAKANDFVIVTKDSDFYELSLLYGTPPRVIWLQVGNVTKGKITQILLEHRDAIEQRFANPETACIEIG
ncbi:MAG: DUF5615 family PIN-like protein [Chromatiaceae bacterium]|nr:DUF5615 family PIN-like protein [Chromatiaceae bacterium]